MEILLQHVALSCALSISAVGHPRTVRRLHEGALSTSLTQALSSRLSLRHSHTYALLYTGVHAHRRSLTQALTRTDRLSPALSLFAAQHVSCPTAFSARAAKRTLASTNSQSAIGSRSEHTYLSSLYFRINGTKSKSHNRKNQEILKKSQIILLFFFAGATYKNLC